MSTAQVWKPSQVVPTHEEGDGRAAGPASASSDATAIGSQTDHGSTSMILKTLWYRRMLCRNVARVTRREIEELFRIIDTARSGKITAVEIRNVLGRALAHAPAQEEQEHEKARILIEQVLALVETDAEGKFDMEQFRQAMLLGTDRDPVAFASRLRGDDPEVFRKVQRRRLVKYLRRRREIRDGCFSLPFTFVWFSVFFALVLAHTRQQTVYRLTEAVARNAAPMVEMQTGYPGSLFSWLNSHIGEPDAARYNRIIGGVHVSKASEDKDDHNLTALSWYNKFDFVSDVMRTGGGWVRKSPEHTKPKFTGDGSNGRDDCAWILWPLRQESVALNISQVQSWWQWLAADSPVTLQNMSNAVPFYQPERTEVRMLSYNAKLSFYVLYRVTFMARASGAIEVTEKASAFDAEPIWLDAEKDTKAATRRAIMAFDIVFALMLCCLFFMKMWEVRTALKNNQADANGGSTAFNVIVNRWFLLDWCCIFGGVCYIWMYFYQNYLMKQFLALVDVLPTVNATGLTRPMLDVRVAEVNLTYSNYILHLDACQEQALMMEAAVEDSRWFIIAFAICCGLRFFKAFKGNARMNFVLQTMSKASVDLGHFLIIFVLVFLSFVVIGHMTFGGTIDDFSTFGKATHTTFLIMMGFVFDEYKVKMFDSTASLGIAWTAVFNLVMGLLLLNMILAIIFDVYRDVRSGTVESQSALQQLWEFWIATPSGPEEMPEPLKAFQDDSLPDGRFEPLLWNQGRSNSVSSVAVEPGRSLQVRPDPFGSHAWTSQSLGMLPAASQTSSQAYPVLSLETPQSLTVQVSDSSAGRSREAPMMDFRGSEASWNAKDSELHMPGASMLLQPGAISSTQASAGGSLHHEQSLMVPSPMSSVAMQPASSMTAVHSYHLSPAAAGASPAAHGGMHGVSSMVAMHSHHLTPAAAGLMPSPAGGMSAPTGASSMQANPSYPPTGAVSSTVPSAGDFKAPQPSSSASQMPKLTETSAEEKENEERVKPAEAEDGRKKSCCKRCCSKCCKRKKNQKLTEGRILSVLLKTYGVSDKDAGDQLVGVEDLAEKLSVTKKTDIWQLQRMINSAAKEASIEEEDVSLMDEVRLCGRIDANVREIGAMVTDIAMRAQEHSTHCQMIVNQRLRERHAAEQAEALRAAQEASQKAEEEKARHMVSRFQVEDTKRSELEAKILPESDDNRVRGVDRDSPEPEPPIGSLDSILEERLRRAAEAQAERHLHLEKAISRLTDRLEPMLKVSAEETESLPGRLERLESKVKTLAGKLDPILTNFAKSFDEMEFDFDKPLQTKNAFAAEA